MKLVLIIKNESWFWAYDEDDMVWHAFYEADLTTAAVKVRHLDRPTVNEVMLLVAHMTEQAMLEIVEDAPNTKPEHSSIRIREE